MNFAHSDRLKLIRDKKNKTQQELADLIEIPVHKIKSIETNKAKISIEIALKIEEKLNFSFKWLLTGEGPVYKEVPITNNQKLLSEKAINYDPDQSNITKVVIEHQSIVTRFKDPKRGLRINERLLDIQDTSDELFDRVDSYIEGVHSAAMTLNTVSKKKPKDGEDTQDKSTA